MTLKQQRHEGDPNWEVTIAWRCYQQLRAASVTQTFAPASKVALQVLDSFHTCPMPDIARLGRTLRQWRQQFLAYFTTNRTNNGGTEAVNGIIQLRRRIARGLRNPLNYRRRMTPRRRTPRPPESPMSP